MLTLRYNEPVFILMLRGRVGCLRQPTLPLSISLLRSWVRIPLGAWMFVCCVLSRRGSCDGQITRPEESY